MIDWIYNGDTDSYKAELMLGNETPSCCPVPHALLPRTALDAQRKKHGTVCVHTPHGH